LKITTSPDKLEKWNKNSPAFYLMQSKRVNTELGEASQMTPVSILINRVASRGSCDSNWVASNLPARPGKKLNKDGL